jgi:hypothetical protein
MVKFKQINLEKDQNDVVNFRKDSFIASFGGCCRL